MEKLTSAETGIQGKMIPLQAGWSDMGAWDAVWAHSERDSNGNALSGDVILDHSSNSLVLATSRLVACAGIDHLVVVETPDAVLVADDRHVQDVKNIVGALKAGSSTLSVDHRKVHRPWGWYDTLESGEYFQVKHILVNPGASISLQSHQHRSEHWTVVKGTAKVTCGDKVLLLSENQTTCIPAGARHRLENQGQIPLEVIEVQYGSYCGEDDIRRYEDLYGRDSEEG